MNPTHVRVNYIETTFTVKKSEWARGGRNGPPALLNNQGNRCCVGFLVQELGHDDDEVNQLDTMSGVYKLTERERNLADAINDCGIYDANDQRTLMTEKQRIKLLQEKFRKLHIEMKVVP